MIALHSVTLSLDTFWHTETYIMSFDVKSTITLYIRMTYITIACRYNTKEYARLNVKRKEIKTFV